MADDASAHHKRGSIKSSVGSVAVQRRREHSVMVGKERREALMRTKRLCRVGVHMDGNADAPADDGRRTIGSGGAMQKRVDALRELRRLLSKSEYPPVNVALETGMGITLWICMHDGEASVVDFWMKNRRLK